MKIITLFISMLFSSLLFAQQKDTSTYVLKGKIEDFQLLYTAVKSPIDVTPRQRDSVIVRWIETIKPEEKKEDKPKTTK